MTQNAYASFFGPAHEEYLRQKQREEADSRRHKKQIERLKRFAMKLDQRDLAELFAYRSQMLVIVRSILRIKSDSLHIVKLLNEMHAIRADGYVEKSQQFSKMVEKNRSDRRKGALKRHANDEKQAAKLEVRKFWDEWKAGKHRKIRTVEQFATETLRKWPVLTSANVIRKWSAQWTKESKPTQPC